MTWIVLALFSAISAAAVAIFGKLGLKDIDSTLATTIRSLIMTVFLLAISFSLGKFQQSKMVLISQKDWVLITCSALAGAVSWLCYFMALKFGPAAAVSAIDRLSLVFVVIFAAAFLAEAWTIKTLFGVLSMVLGAFLITFK